MNVIGVPLLLSSPIDNTLSIELIRPCEIFLLRLASEAGLRDDHCLTSLGLKDLWSKCGTKSQRSRCPAQLVTWRVPGRKKQLLIIWRHKFYIMTSYYLDLLSFSKYTSPFHAYHPPHSTSLSLLTSCSPCHCQIKANQFKTIPKTSSARHCLTVACLLPGACLLLITLLSLSLCVWLCQCHSVVIRNCRRPNKSINNESATLKLAGWVITNV